MSSDNNDRSSNSNIEKLKNFGKKLEYYFDIFYRVTKAFAGYILLILFVMATLGGGVVIGYFASLVEQTPIPTHDEIERQVYDFNTKSTLYYADNSKISDLRSDLIRTPIKLDEISPLIINALIATEDEYFYEHEGIVPKALLRAGIQEVTNAASVTGGSTITQQLIKQQLLTSEVTHSRKAVEILYATHMENSFSKEEILEAYMNISPFGRNNLGQNIAGIEEGAQGIFGVAASEVNLPQAAYLAGLPKSPIAYSPYTQQGEIKENLDDGIRRQKEVLYSLYREGYITKEDYDTAREYDISADFLQRSNESDDDPSRSYVYDIVERESRDIIMNSMLEDDGITQEQLEESPELKDEYYNRADNEIRNGGYKIYSTIDPTVHHAIEQRVDEIKDSFGSMQTVTYTDDNGETQTIEYEAQISSSLTENNTGRIIAFVGGRDYDYSEYNNAFDSRRHTGSAIKPLITYGPALEERVITPATIIPDTELVVPSGDGTHNIRNVGRITDEWRDARHWLKMSQNIPNTKIYMEMRKQNIDVSKYIRAMGIGPDAISDDEFANPSTSLGGYSHGPTAVELSAAYAALGNNGVFNPAYIIEKIEKGNEVIYEHEPNPVRVWSEATNYILYDMLRDVSKSGTAQILPSYLNFNIDLASKTGTSNDTKDVWYAGVTPKVSLVTWMGYDDQQHLNLHDYNGLEPYQRNIRNWANIMNTVYNTKPELLGLNERVQMPADGSVVRQSVLADTGMKSGNVSIPDGKSVAVTGQSKNELFIRGNVPGKTIYNFAIGAKSKELEDFWNERSNDIEKKEKEKEKENKDKNDKKEKEEDKEKTDSKDKNEDKDKKDKDEDKTDSDNDDSNDDSEEEEDKDS